MDWVWYSTEESREKRQVSILAIFEVVIAVAIYWGVALYFDWYGHIWASVTFAPFLLLRSQSSNEDTIKSVSMLILKSYRLTFNNKITKFLLKNNESQYYVILLVSIYLIYFVIIFFAKTFEVIFQYKVFSFYFNLSIFYQLIISVLFPAVVVFLPIQFVKGYSVLCHLFEGIKNFKKNWIDNCLVNDLKTKIEIISGINDSSNVGFSIIRIKNIIISTDRYLYHFNDYGFFLRKTIIFFLFSYLASLLIFTLFYRLSIKSTFWFYLPLLFLVKSPQNFNSSNNIGKFLSLLHQTKASGIRLLFAFLIIAAFFITYFSNYDLKKLTEPYGMFVVAMYLDFSQVELWKLFQLAVAGLTIFLYFYSDSIRTSNVSNNIELEYNGPIKLIFRLNLFRNLCSFFYFSLAILYLSWYFQVWNYKYMPDWVQGFLNWSVKIVTYSFG